MAASLSRRVRDKRGHNQSHLTNHEVSELHCRGVGRGAGVGRGRGVGVVLGVALGLVVGVGLAVEVGVGEGVWEYLMVV